MKKQFLLLLAALVFIFTGCTSGKYEVNYADSSNWAVLPHRSQDEQPADVFFVAPTVFMGSDTEFNMPLGNPELNRKFTGAINMQKAIYNKEAAFYAPYYRQAGLNVFVAGGYNLNNCYTNIAYTDVKHAFKYFLNNYNNNRPFVLAGFSQGAYIVLELMKDVLKDQNINKRLVAAYIIGWPLTEADLKQAKWLKPAKKENDTGVIISFNTEAIGITASPVVPGGSISINPLSWKTDKEIALYTLNEGAVFTDYDGNEVKEIRYLTGAYIDSLRGTLKVTDIKPEDYPPLLSIFEEGVYHMYDYQFFFRNLQNNVPKRIAEYKRINPY